MKKNIITLIFVSLFFIVNAQKVTYKAVFINQCPNSKEEMVWYLNNIKIVNDSIQINSFLPDSNGIVTLLDTGSYSVPIDIYEILKRKSLHLTEFKHYQDTFNLSKLYLEYRVGGKSRYMDCGNWANGKVIDYYFSGKIRKIGTFQNGELIDTFKSFDNQGNILQLITPEVSYYYFKNGNIRSIYHSLKYSKNYFETGQLKEEFYFNKNKRLKYNEKGVLVFKEKRKKRKIYSDKGDLIEYQKIVKERNAKRGDTWYRKRITYNWIKFDSLGNKLWKIKHTQLHYKRSFVEELDKIENYEIDYVILYNKGKKFKKIIIYLDDVTDDYKLIYRQETYLRKNRTWIKIGEAPFEELKNIIDEHEKAITR